MRDDKEQTSLAVKMLHTAAACDPDADGFGVLVTEAARDEVPGRRMVLWFASPTVLADFLLQAYPLLFCRDDNAEELLEKLEPFKAYLCEEGLSQSALDELNEYTEQWTQMEWLGTFQDLCASDTEPTQRVVEGFRADQRDEGNAPVTDEEIEDFIEFLTGLNES